MTTVQRILVPTDFSPAADLALQYAIKMATRLGAEIQLLHVVDDASFGFVYPDGAYAPAAPELRDTLVREATERLEKAAAASEAAAVPTTREVLVGRPARVIVEAAKSRGADLIVMGTHGRGALAHALLGSVTERVMRTAPCAVLTVRDNSLIADVLAAERVAASAS